nr:MAG TPA: hypothetical protein [Caudoviricetes sp.]
MGALTSATLAIAKLIEAIAKLIEAKAKYVEAKSRAQKKRKPEISAKKKGKR